MCSECFGDNVFHTLCEFFYHQIFTFLFIWRRTYRKLVEHFNEIKEAHRKKQKNEQSQKVYMLYDDFFNFTFNKYVQNPMKISDFSSTIELSFKFTI